MGKTVTLPIRVNFSCYFWCLRGLKGFVREIFSWRIVSFQSIRSRSFTHNGSKTTVPHVYSLNNNNDSNLIRECWIYLITALWWGFCGYIHVLSHFLFTSPPWLWFDSVKEGEKVLKCKRDHVKYLCEYAHAHTCHRKTKCFIKNEMIRCICKQIWVCFI